MADLKAWSHGVRKANLPDIRHVTCHTYSGIYLMDNLYVRLNLDVVKKSKIYHHSSKERLKISKITKFGGQML